MSTCIQQFGDKLPGHIRELLNKLSTIPELTGLQQSLSTSTDIDRFFDIYAEAVIADHLLCRGWKLAYEEGDPNSKKADFKLIKGSDIVFLHIKRLNLAENLYRAKILHSRFAPLKTIRQPLMCSLLFHREGTNMEYEELYSFLKRMLSQGNVGNGEIDPPKDQSLLVEWEICSWKSNRVRLEIQSQGMEDNTLIQFKNQLKTAYGQFQCGGNNIIAMSSVWKDDVDDFVEALYGCTATIHCHPTRKTISNVYGPFESDSFWANERNSKSNIALWYNFDKDKGTVSFQGWLRNDHCCSDSILEAFDGPQLLGNC